MLPRTLTHGLFATAVFLGPSLVFHTGVAHPAPWLALGVAMVLLGSQPALDLRETLSRSAPDRGSAMGITLAVTVALLAASIQFAASSSSSSPGGGWLLLAGGGIAMAGLGLRLWAIRTLGRSFTSTVSVKAGQSVITVGPYRVLRHPSYTGALLATLGVTVALESPVGSMLVLLLVVPAYRYRISAEERALRAALGDAYERYSERTWALVPWGLRGGRRKGPAVSATLLLLAALPAISYAGAPSFTAPFRGFDAPGYPQSVAVGDVDGDGILDVVAGCRVGDAVRLYGAAANGTLSARADIAVGTEPAFVAFADVNGDTHLDLLVARDSVALAVLLGHGDGTFAAPVTYRFGGVHTTALEVADLNGDGHLDVLIAYSDPSRSRGVVSALGAGDGTFGAFQFAVTGILFSEPLAAIGTLDANEDGIPDLVIGHGHGVEVCTGRTDGTFQPLLHIAAGNVKALALADFNGDGHADLAFGMNPGMAVALADGLGGFASPVHYSPTIFQVNSLALADVDGDGRADLIAADGTEGRFSILHGNADGSFQISSAWDTGCAFNNLYKASPEYLLGADVNGDGRADVITVCGNTNEIAVHLGNNGGSFGNAVQPAIGARPMAVAAADLDEDSVPDVVTANLDSTASILRGLPGGGLAPAQKIPLGERPLSLGLGDVDGDGHVDLVASMYDSSVVLRPGTGAGSFGAPTFIPVAGLPYNLQVADLNGDGIEDVVALCANQQMSVLLSLPGGGHEARVDYPMGADALCLADLDGDGVLDAVTLQESISRVYVRRGLGDGRFGPISSLAFTAQAMSLTVADVDEDGLPDILVSSPGEILCFRGIGGASFAPATTAASSIGLFFMASGDLDGDGHLDLIGSNEFARGVVVLPGRGDGSFAPALDYGSGAGAAGFAVTDLNRDGFPDLAVANTATTSITLLASTQAALGVPPSGEVLEGPRLSASPNPARSTVAITFNLARAAVVRLRVFDVTGRVIRTLDEGPRQAGAHVARWDARTSGGSPAAPGVYLCELEVSGRRSAHRIVLMR